MSLGIVTFAYTVTVLLACGLLYVFGARSWYWHALSVAAGLILGAIPMSVFGATLTPVFDLALGNVIVFLLTWGVAAPFFRHHHLPLPHH